MATLWIREYSHTKRIEGRSVAEIADEPGRVDQNVTYTTSTQSAAFNAGTNFIAIISDADFHYLVGPNPTSTTAKLMVPANTLLFMGVTPGDKIAAITAA